MKITKEYIKHIKDLVRETAIETMQEVAISLIALYPCKTARELAALGGHAESNLLRPRITELHQRDFIENAGVRVCTVTGCKEMTWRLKIKKRMPEPKGAKKR